METLPFNATQMAVELSGLQNTSPFLPFHVFPSSHIYICFFPLISRCCLGGETSPFRSPDPPASEHPLPEDVAEILRQKTLELGQTEVDGMKQGEVGEEKKCDHSEEKCDETEETCEETKDDHSDNDGLAGGGTPPPPKKTPDASLPVSPSLVEIANSQVWGLLD